jgi:short-subunit dehydrogenase
MSSPARALAGRVVAITGASAGIGAALAREVARRDGRLAVFARREDRLDALAREITRHAALSPTDENARGDVVCVAGDVARPVDVERFVAATLAAHGRLDVMVANAGAGFQGALSALDDAGMARLLDVNFMGTFHAARAAWPIFQAQGHGHLLVVSSIVGRRALAGGSAYAATKFAQVGFAEALRVEGRPHGIHVTTVFPVSTETEFRDAIARDHGIEVRGRGPRQTAERVARAMADAIERPRPEVYPFPAARLLAVAAAAAPRLTDFLVSRLRRETVAGAEPGP